MHIDRPAWKRRVREAFSVHPVVTVTGPRQCGKTTLARAIAADSTPAAWFDLEAAVDRRRLSTPEMTLGPLRGLIVIDEVQRSPRLYETIRVLVDRTDNRARFLLLGSASPTLAVGVSESLAGRVGLVDLAGFDLDEVGADAWRALWLRGGFPRSYLAGGTARSALWRRNFVRTFLERDVPQLGITIPAEALHRFWQMVAHYHGGVWNRAEFARALGVGENAARRYLDILAGAFMVRVLPPWFENLRKRQVKSPKIYVRDSGLLHTLLGIADEAQLGGHPKVGASFEGFVVEQVLAAFTVDDAYFWGTHAGAELDLLIQLGGARYGFECKLADAPGATRSMRVAVTDLGLRHLYVVYPGTEAYPLGDAVSALPASGIPALARTLAATGGSAP